MFFPFGKYKEVLHVLVIMSTSSWALWCWTCPLLFVTVPVGSCMEASLVAHVFLILGAVFVESSRKVQSAICWVSLFRVSVLFQSARRGG